MAGKVMGTSWKRLNWNGKKGKAGMRILQQPVWNDSHYTEGMTNYRQPFWKDWGCKQKRVFEQILRSYNIILKRSSIIFSLSLGHFLLSNLCLGIPYQNNFQILPVFNKKLSKDTWKLVVMWRDVSL